MKKKQSKKKILSKKKKILSESTAFSNLEKKSNKTSRNQILKVTELAMAIQKSLIKKKMIRTSI